MIIIVTPTTALLAELALMRMSWSFRRRDEELIDSQSIRESTNKSVHTVKYEITNPQQIFGYKQMSLNPPGRAAELVCVWVSFGSQSDEREEKQEDPLPGLLMHYQLAAPQQESATTYRGVELL